MLQEKEKAPENEATVRAGRPSVRERIIARRIERMVRGLLEEPVEARDPLAAEALDSLAVEQLIEQLEQTYEISFDDEELVAENFSSIARLAQLVNDKRRGGAAVA